MVARRLLLLALAVILLGSSGCCVVRRVMCDECCPPCDMGAFSYFAGQSCGEPYCGDWHSHPPNCDPCDDCGNHVGGPRRAFGRRGPAMMAVGADCECGGH